MSDSPDLEQLQLLAQAHRDSRPRLSERQAVDEITSLIARFLHYQDRGEPNWNEIPTEEFLKEYRELPQDIVNRYRTDNKFHAQVDRAVAAIVDVWDRCSQRRIDNSEKP